MGLFDWFRRKRPAGPPPLPPPASRPAPASPPAPAPTQGSTASSYARPIVPPSVASRPAPPPPPIAGTFFNADLTGVRVTAMSPTPGVPAGPAQRPVASPVMAGQAQPSSGARRPGRAPPPAESTDLDLGPFAPLAGADLKDAAGKLKDDWRSRWLFGRSHRIPPTADPRTNLIDRAMVAQGLLSPEELAEIHRVGDEWDRLRPDLQVELAKAELALPDTEQERLARKAQKRAEAAERRRLRAEQVAQRRATDIVYLGRGVSSRLHDRGSDVAKLEAAGLPVLSTPADVAAALGLSVPRLRWLAFHADAATVSHYVRFEVLKRSGGTRQLAAPHKHLATAQQWVLANVLTKVPTHPAAHGFVPGRSTVTNAAAHVGRRLVVNADLSDFFPSITFPRVRGVFRQLGYSPAVATVLALLCTECPRRTVTYAGRPFHVATGPRGLPQGACTSPALSNLAARRFDSRLNGIASKLGWTFTRYADDLTFSSAAGDEAERKVGYLLARVRHIADDEGFAVNEKKTRVLRPSAAQTVTGIVVNERLGVSRDTVRRLRAILHRAKAEGLAAQNRENHPHYEAWVRGMVAYVHMVNPQQAAPLRAALDAL